MFNCCVIVAAQGYAASYTRLDLLTVVDLSRPRDTLLHVFASFLNRDVLPGGPQLQERLDVAELALARRVVVKDDVGNAPQLKQLIEYSVDGLKVRAPTNMDQMVCAQLRNQLLKALGHCEAV